MTRRFVVAVLCLFCLCAAAARAQVSVVYSFAGTTDGEYPEAALTQGADGSFYGSTNAGGTDGMGTLFKVSQTGTFTLLHTFTGGSDGAGPAARLIQGGDGNFYGTTDDGGADGAGTIFKVTPSGTFTLLATLASGITNGLSAPLVEGSDGNFYGANYGDDPDGANGFIYQMTPGGAVTVLHTFDGNDGNDPAARLVESSVGLFYGTAITGGSNSDGVFFSVTSGGAYNDLYNFLDSTDGAQPDGIVLGSDGNFYGYARIGGQYGFGTAFKISPNGSTLTPLHQFTGESDGGYPTGVLVQASDGNFYGDTGTFSVPQNIGTIFQLTSAGVYTLLTTFNNTTPVFTPAAGLLSGSDGNFYDASKTGGSADSGTVFEFQPSTALTANVQVSLSKQSAPADTPVTLSYSTLDGFSTTMQQCYGFVSTGDGSPTALGKIAGTLSKGVYSGSTTVTPVAAGTYNYAVTCGGIESGFATLTVTASTRNTTTTAVTASQNPASVGQSVILKATVAHASGSAVPTGKVSFSVGGTAFGSATVNGSGIATLSATTNGIAPGNYPVVATYPGDANYDPSTSSAYTVTLDKAPTSTTVTASPNPVTPPAKCTLTATVKRTASGATGYASGSVTFSVGTTTIGAANLNPSGVATLSASTSGIAAANYPVTAKYNGDASDVASSSSAVTVTVQ